MIGLSDEISRFSKYKRKSRISKKIFSSSKLGDGVSLDSKFEELSLERNARYWNALIFIVFSIGIFFIFVARAFDLQIIHGEENRVLADGNRIRITNVMAERGLIRDKNGEILVQNKPAFSIQMATSKCRLQGIDTCKSDYSFFQSKFNLEVNNERVLEDLNKGKDPVVLSTGLTKEEILPVEALLSDYPGFSVSVSPIRDYLFKDAFFHLLGYVGFGDTLYPTIEGKAGVEDFYNRHLTGIDGQEIVQVNSTGQKVNVLNHRESVHGEELVLYADQGLQTLAYELLKEKVEKEEAKAGVVVAQDPQTGGILAMVSYPSYDPNKLTGGLSHAEYDQIINDPTYPFFNRAIAGTYPPASTFKMVMAAATLMEKVLDPYYEITDNGFIQVGSFIFKNWNTGGHGLVNIWRALQVSNDTYFYTAGGGYGGVGGLGIERIHDWATRFGFGEKTGIDLNGEVSGFMPDGEYKDWYLGDTYITSIGQGDVLATPLQVNNVTSYFGNGGFLYAPRVVRSTNGVETDTEVISQSLVSPENYEIVREGLKKAVEPGGTGYPFFDFPDKYGVEVAGKTGTAEFGASENEDTHAWFTVFGPYDNAEIAVTVFLEEGGAGSDDAAPIARKLFDYWFEKYYTQNNK